MQRLLPSRIANSLIARVTGVRLHDYGCSLKAYRREVVSDLNLYGELHRFLPALAFIEGARISEVKVNHHPRRYGESKYGLDRTFRVLMDLLTVWFMKRFLTRPMHVFGLGGLAAMGAGLLIGVWLVGEKLLLGADIGDRPLLLMALLSFLTGCSSSALACWPNCRCAHTTKVRDDRSTGCAASCADPTAERRGKGIEFYVALAGPASCHGWASYSINGCYWPAP